MYDDVMTCWLMYDDVMTCWLMYGDVMNDVLVDVR